MTLIAGGDQKKTRSGGVDCQSDSCCAIGTLLISDATHLELELQKALIGLIDRRPTVTVGPCTLPNRFTGTVVLSTAEHPLVAYRAGRVTTEFFERATATMIRVPPLCAHQGDVPELVDHFLHIWGARNAHPVLAPPVEFYDACARDGWATANVAELKDFVLKAAPQVRTPSDWMMLYWEHVEKRRRLAEAGGRVTFEDRVAEFERSELSHALRTTGWNQAAAARLLSLPEATLRRKIKRLGLGLPE
jgi:DNA-binding NtrC family response regulator